MTTNAITPPFEHFEGIDGLPLENGFVYIGTANQNAETSPISVYWDKELTIPAAQPIRTISGYMSKNGAPGALYCSTDYSITVRDRNGVLVYSALNSTQLLYNSYSNISDLATIDSSTANYVIVTDLNRGGIFIWSATGTANGGTIFAGLTGFWHRQYQGTIKVEWFGALCDGTTDDTIAIAAADAIGDIEITNDTISTSTTATNYTGAGTVYSSVGVINLAFTRLGNIGGNSDRNHFALGCIPRCAAGVFSMIDDTAHHPLNVSSITQPDDYIIRTNYAKTATKINSFIIQQDNELAPYGVDIGGDVGLSYANATAYTQFNAYMNGTTVNAHGLISADTSASIASNVLTVTHETAVTNDVPVASVVHTNPANTAHIAVGYNATQTSITALSDISGYLAYNGTAWAISLTNNDTTEASFATASPTAGGTIKVTHASCSDYNVQLTPHGTTYRVATTNIGLDLFEVAFINNAGTVITTPNTNMKVWFRRKALVKSTYPTGMGVLIRRGNVKVKSARFSNVTGNNFWVSGTMEY